jgi:hypothetical protein
MKLILLSIPILLCKNFFSKVYKELPLVAFLNQEKIAFPKSRISITIRAIFELSFFMNNWFLSFVTLSAVKVQDVNLKRSI